MGDEISLARSNLWRRYRSLAIVFLLVSGLAVALAIRDRPPRPLIPATGTERRVLAIASRAIARERVDWKVAVNIAPGTKVGTFVVTYWTPRSEVQLAGPRVVIVNLEDETVEFPVHE